MSYDILFLRREPGQSFDDALEADEERQIAASEGISCEDPLVIAAADEVRRAVVEMIGPDAKVDTGRPGIDIYDPATRVLLEYHWEGVSISTTFGPDPSPVTRISAVFRTAEIIERLTGLEGYDRQIEMALREPGAFATSVAAYGYFT
ncbi:hypothetical protein DW322_05020 [Rhodococcus rhodnii]|uniref:Uncharacterized protein n=2 Tax=Rhodococcus rhodnii TaxID=38312 RepID=R7WHE6_9NOCA|nr:hypothetical protein [Rhodococcus rhodnii]EOM74538.1 hypothetical protein Rrhod_4127 [Rhodococcus rhodnii LMG 5362]TXG89696.1 hypothetical protein DW322_05020 [Rhodococcus rhodnii]